MANFRALGQQRKSVLGGLLLDRKKLTEQM
jgi:hypothetical protein